MTKEQLAKIPFTCMSHLSMEHEHASTYVNTEYGFAMCRHTKVKEDYSFGRTYTHYLYRNKVYKSLPKFLEAIKDVPFKGEKNCETS